EANLKKKKELMKVATQQFNKLLDYEVGEVTAASTFYLAEIYARFSKDLRESERPSGLNALELEEYELALEEQAYPFEEKAIATHQKNLELLTIGIYNEWIDKSLEKLAVFVPARYNKPEEESAVIASVDTYQFAIERPAPPAPPAGETKQEAKPDDVKEAAPVPASDAAPADVKEGTEAEKPASGADTSGGQGAQPDTVVK
ncbi:MAG TPA: hypothetical protein VIX18_05190, partial [Nitrospirota bacterium]